jgi:ribosomal protein L7/L12
MDTKELLETIRNLDFKQTRELADGLRAALHIDALPSFTDEADRFKGAINPPRFFVRGVETEAVNVILAAMGANKIQVIKVVRETTGLGLAEELPIDDAKKLAGQLEAAGATVRLE